MVPDRPDRTRLPEKQCEGSITGSYDAAFGEVPRDINAEHDVFLREAARRMLQTVECDWTNALGARER